MARRIIIFTRRMAKEFAYAFMPGKLSTIFQSPIIWHNVRSTWIQSDREWFRKMLDKNPPLEAEESADISKILDELREDRT